MNEKFPQVAEILHFVKKLGPGDKKSTATASVRIVTGRSHP